MYQRRANRTNTTVYSNIIDTYCIIIIIIIYIHQFIFLHFGTYENFNDQRRNRNLKFTTE